jgi:hypothetical protein
MSQALSADKLCYAHLTQANEDLIKRIVAVAGDKVFVGL